MDDTKYFPWREGLSWLAAAPVDQLLVLGKVTEEDVAALAAVNADVRTAAEYDAFGGVPRGVYASARRGRWRVLAMADGGPEEQASSFETRYRDVPWVELALRVRSDEWGDAVPFGGGTDLTPGSMVRVRSTSELGTVRKITRMAAGYQVTVEVAGLLREYPETALERLAGDPRSPAFWTSQPPARSTDLALTLTHATLRNPLTDVLYSFAASKTVFRPYQFLPAIKVLSSGTGRLLVADEVGLGKTIEAGLVWNELDQRHDGGPAGGAGRLRRALVVAPSALTHKWRDEMNRRFDRKIEIIKPDRLQELADDIRTGGDPEVQAVISLESLRSATTVLEALNEVNPRFDLIIVDEAHQMRNTGRRSNRLGHLLSDWSDYLLFLSATPINLREDDLFNLLEILDEGSFYDKDVFRAQLEPNALLNETLHTVATAGIGRTARTTLKRVETVPFGRSLAMRPDFDRLLKVLDVDRPLEPEEWSEARRFIAELSPLSGVLTRTRKIDVPGTKAVREAYSVEVEWTSEEKAVYDAVETYFRDRARYEGIPVGFAMQMPLRQAASCLPALLRRAQTEAERGVTVSPVDDPDELFDEGSQDVERPAAPAWAEMLASSAAFRRGIRVDSKYEAFVEDLRRLRDIGVRQVMVFSTFPGTLEYLLSRVRPEFTAAVMHGKTPIERRVEVMEQFRAGEFDLLLLSEVGSEGLDFETCNAVVNYDLPWNPMRVEQRIGRVDRFGQQSEKIFVRNMHVPGTIESDILERLYQRIGVFERSIGDLEPILRSHFKQYRTELLTQRLSPEEARRRQNEIAVAIENNRREIERIEESRATLATADHLRIEGMGEEGPDRGRFVGRTEIERLVRRLLVPTGSRLTGPDENGILLLRGTPELAEKCGHIRGERGRGTTFPLSRLEGAFRTDRDVRVTFDADTASKHDVDLLSVRHPLVSLALLELERSETDLRRFGAVAVPGIAPDQYLLARVDLAQTSGLRPRLELWSTAIDATSHAAVPGAEDALLAAVATGTLRDAHVPDDFDARGPLPVLARQIWDRRTATEATRAQDNAALIDGRVEARERYFRIKIDRATASAREYATKDPSYAKGQLTRAGNLRESLEREKSRISQSRELAVSLTPVAVLVVTGTIS
ncbi:SNF2-related protein [Antribacter sp. KLBMP9083]|uniref:SNF2-related protein n=1 Tax=Antribacter soli TaxID=2910976 RepID=A0AA41U7V7_9MICO|nr:helicase-related protein [Antribacter soli]MCF4122011.1 SNF2-related protein [Antribacter soli]